MSRVLKTMYIKSPQRIKQEKTDTEIEGVDNMVMKIK